MRKQENDTSDAGGPGARRALRAELWVCLRRLVSLPAAPGPASSAGQGTSGQMKLHCELALAEVAQLELAPVLWTGPYCNAWTSPVFPLQGLVLLG